MKSTSTKQTLFNTVKNTLTRTLIGFTVFLTILALGSCAEEITAPPGGDPPGPQPDYMSFTLTNRSGATVGLTTQLSRGSTYGLVITPGSGVVPATADYTITYTPVTAITGIATNTNSVDFTVNNTADTTVTVTVTHRTASAISETITLNLAPLAADYMSFTLTNLGGGPLVTPTTQLSVGDGYRLIITPASATTIPTADYTIGYSPADAIIIDTRISNSVDFTLDNTVATSVTFTVAHRTNSSIRQSITFNIAGGIVFGPGFQSDIMGSTVPNLVEADALTREVLSPISPLGSIRGGATLEKRYVTESGGGSYNGSSWTDAWAATNLRNGINSITDATANRVYLVMVAGGTYKPSYVGIGNVNDSFRMRDYVAIMGGFQTGGGWDRTGTTIFSGDIGTVGDNSDNAFHVFANNDGVSTYRNSHLYGVVITGGRGGGAGMINDIGTSPNITKVIFSNNNTIFTLNGGGMYNNQSSPVLTSVVFNGNTADGNGGGMYNVNSSPVLINVVFSGNIANGTATTSGGGGMYNTSSSPVIIGAVFTNNRAANGGGMFNDNGGQPGPLIVNSIFSANTLSGSGSGANIAVNRRGFYTGTENIHIAGSVLGLGLAQPTNAIVGYNGTDALNISYHSLANGAVNFGADATTGVLTYPTITGGSAVNLGLYVWKHVNGSAITYYFSETGTGTSWHTGFTTTGGLAGTAVTLPTTSGTIENLTARDIAGNARNVRPDAGVHEVQ